MLNNFLFIILFSLSHTISNAQNVISSLSQRTNYFLSVDSHNLTWISSTDGVNMYNGHEVIQYKPGSYHLIGNNIQSKFYEDCNTNIWFSTYNALHVYDRIKNNFRPFQYIADGNLIDSGYKVLGYNDGFVFFRYGDFMAVLDINTEKVVRKWNLGLSVYAEFDIIFQGKGYSLTAANTLEVVLVKCSNILLNEPEKEKYYKGFNVGIVQFLDHTNILINEITTKSILLYSIKDHKTRTFFAHGIPVKSFVFDRVTQILYLEDGVNLYALKDQFGKWTTKWTNKIKFRGNTTRINLLGEILWYGIDGKGLVFFNLHKRKFDHFQLISGGKPANARSIKQDLSGNYWYCSRDNGIGKFNSDGKLLAQYNTTLKNSATDVVFGIEILNNGKVLGVGGQDFILYNTATNKFERIMVSGQNSTQFFGGLQNLFDGLLITWDYNNPNGIYYLKQKNTNNFYLEPLNIVSGQASDFYSNVIQGPGNYIFLGINATHVGLGILKGKNLTIMKKWLVNSSINSVSYLDDDIYFSTGDGLYELKDGIKGIPKKLTDKMGYLNQCIYHILGKDDKLYLSTNDGILSYYPGTNETQHFGLADGVQDLEFNKTAALKDKDGYFLFGGINGINRFHPDSIQLMRNKPPVFISELLINDVKDTIHRNHSLVNKLDLEYDRNTVSFRFNAIDYADPDAVSLEYQLIDYDKNPVKTRENEGFARYANLPPGEYRFEIFSTNTDGIRNDTPHAIDIKVKPPFWKTWWFLTLMGLSILGLGYYMMKSYYKRKLEKQNQLLREQALIIEKQEAIEHERTRIASEMHDDLGAGLTTIRYLSDKALTHAKDLEEKNQIGRIADHSNALVRNMSEIIWALNSRFDTTENLIGYLRRYATEYLSEHKIPLEFTTDSSDIEISISGEKRRNVFLVMKELLHNSIKYSGAKVIEIKITIEKDLIMTIFEKGGSGFDPDVDISKGNGIYNIQKRMSAIGGRITYNKGEEGMYIYIFCPINQ